jgi:hypothetical protein
MYANSHKASAKARMSRTETEDDVETDINFLANYTNQQGPCFSNNNCGPMNVPYLLWKLLDAGTQKTIREAHEARTEKFRGTRGDTNSRYDSSDTKPAVKTDSKNKVKEGGIPRQYSNTTDWVSNKTGKEESEKKNDDRPGTPDEDPDEVDEFYLWSRLMNNVKRLTVEELKMKGLETLELSG